MKPQHIKTHILETPTLTGSLKVVETRSRIIVGSHCSDDGQFHRRNFNEWIVDILSKYDHDKRPLDFRCLDCGELMRVRRFGGEKLRFMVFPNGSAMCHPKRRYQYPAVS